MRDRWDVLGCQEVFAARPYVVVTRERVRTSRGEVVDDFYRVELPPFVVCVPQTPAGEIITLWSYKHGPRKWGMSFPAGYLAEDEAADGACRRELLEETGYAAGDLHHLGSFVDHGNQQGSVGNYFVASACRLAAAPDSGDLEEMEVRLMPPDAVDRAIRSGEAPVIHHVAAWGLARDRLTRGEGAM